MNKLNKNIVILGLLLSGIALAPEHLLTPDAISAIAERFEARFNDRKDSLKSEIEAFVLDLEGQLGSRNILTDQRKQMLFSLRVNDSCDQETPRQKTASEILFDLDQIDPTSSAKHYIDTFHQVFAATYLRASLMREKTDASAINPEDLVNMSFIQFIDEVVPQVFIHIDSLKRYGVPNHSLSLEWLLQKEIADLGSADSKRVSNAQNKLNRILEFVEISATPIKIDNDFVKKLQGPEGDIVAKLVQLEVLKNRYARENELILTTLKAQAKLRQEMSATGATVDPIQRQINTNLRLIKQHEAALAEMRSRLALAEEDDLDEDEGSMEDTAEDMQTRTVVYMTDELRELRGKIQYTTEFLNDLRAKNRALRAQRESGEHIPGLKRHVSCNRTFVPAPLHVERRRSDPLAIKLRSVPRRRPSLPTDLGESTDEMNQDAKRAIAAEIAARRAAKESAQQKTPEPQQPGWFKSLFEGIGSFITQRAAAESELYAPLNPRQSTEGFYSDSSSDESEQDLEEVFPESEKPLQPASEPQTKGPEYSRKIPAQKPTQQIQDPDTRAPYTMSTEDAQRPATAMHTELRIKNPQEIAFDKQPAWPQSPTVSTKIADEANVGERSPAAEAILKTVLLLPMSFFQKYIGSQQSSRAINTLICFTHIISWVFGVDLQINSGKII